MSLPRTKRMWFMTPCSEQKIPLKWGYVIFNFLKTGFQMIWFPKEQALAIAMVPTI